MKLTDPNGNALVTITQNGVKWKAEFIDGSKFSDPWTTALIIEQKFPVEVFAEELKKVKIKGWWRNKVPVATLIWFFTDGAAFWKNVNVDFDLDDAEKWWKDRLYEALIGIETLLDIIIAFRYFRKTDIEEQIGLYVSHLRELQRRK